ncbi:type II toxin-antitoxin system VapC family toxin [Paraeggerthella hongkongensis]|uniref:PIN domain-containing protein n=1 Tax=Paraeggerthella hongkongensis TaxID=230658 RepID=A0A3N0BKM3_9ACTN|nr:PIN domain-containing protein [Paraeggerthella hongkongensis]RNL48980.1 hypothetical protein DMP08_00515 [Paraeggerthella hongkongensis]
MIAAPSRLLLDSNVWIDLFASDRPGRENAQALVSWAVDREVDLLYAAISIKDVYYLLEEREKRRMRAAGKEITPASAAAINEYAWGCIRAMEEIATVVPVDQSDIWIATKYRSFHGDFEDNLLLAAVERSKADFLVTSDEILLRHAPVATVVPGDLLKLVTA